jgi:hypothetical protein
MLADLVVGAGIQDPIWATHPPNLSRSSTPLPATTRKTGQVRVGT